jgi:hypothetical protein
MNNLLEIYLQELQDDTYKKRILQEQRFTVLGPLLQEIQSPLTTFNLPIEELKSAAKKYSKSYITKTGKSLESWLTLDSADDKKFNSIISVYNFLLQKKYISNLTVPFAEDGGGNYFCFQYKSLNDSSPSIVFWNHESNEFTPKKEANSLQEFLSGLKKGS